MDACNDDQLRDISFGSQNHDYSDKLTLLRLATSLMY